MQSVRLCAPGLPSHKKIDLAVNQDVLFQIIDLASSSPDETRMLRQFVILLLCPPSPFVNSLADPCTFAKELLNQEGQQRQIVASILAASRQDIAQMVFDLNLLQIELTEMPE